MADWIVQNAIWTALFAAVLTIVCKSRDLSPALRHALWLVVLVKFVTPPIPLWSWPAIDESLAPVSKQIAAQVTGAAASNRQVSPPLRVHSSDGRGRLLSWNVAEEVSGGLLTRERKIPAGLVPAVWLAGLLVYLIVQATGFLRFRHKIRAARPAPIWLVDQVGVLADRLGVARPEVGVVPGIHSPLVYGTWRTQLLWPDHMLDEGINHGVRGIIVHELAHAARRDPWIGWLELAATALWWWNPVIWHVRRQLTEHAELACDAWVVKTLPSARRAYGDALIEVQETGAGRHFALAPAVVSGPRRSFERRLTMLMSGELPSRMSRASWVAAVAIALAVLPMWSATTADAQSHKDHGKVHLANGANADYLEVEVSHSTDLSRGVTALEVSTGAGSVEILSSEDGELTVEARVRVREDRVDVSELSDRFDDHVSLSTEGGVLTIESAHQPEEHGNNPWHVSFRVMIPRDLAITADSGAGNVSVSRAGGAVVLSSGAGNVALDVPESTLSQVSARSGAGSVTIRVGSVEGEVSARSGAGSVTCSMISDGAHGAVTLESAAGNVSLELPENADADLDMQTSVGSIHVDSAIELERSTRSVVGERASATLGRGGPQYNLRSAVGSITVSVR